MTTDRSYPAWLRERSPGGEGVAVTPLGGDGANWPVGPSAPISSEACRILVESCRSNAATRVIVVLVGGAGNGKSELARRVAKDGGADLDAARGKFARRDYLFQLPAGGALRIVNDATIPSKDDQALLSRDLADAFAAGEHCLACANRGVLLAESRRKLDEHASDEERFALGLVQWLLRPREGGTFANVGSWTTTVSHDPMPGREHYAFASVTGPGDARFVVHVVYMDHASLLEPTPQETSSAEEGEPLGAQRLVTAPILEAALGDREAVFLRPLMEVAEKVADEMGGNWPGGALDPVAANVASLQSPSFADAWCRTMRAAEIQAGMHFTYRDLWAIATLSVTGPAMPGPLGGWVATLSGELVLAHDDLSRLRHLVALSSVRMPTLLFGDLDPPPPLDPGKPPGAKPVVAALAAARMVDPARDWIAVDKDKVLGNLIERMAGIEDASTPVSDLADSNPDLAAGWSPLEREIEKTISRVVDPSNADAGRVDRRKLLDWYGRMVFRFAGLSLARPAFGDVVSRWQVVLRNALLGRQDSDAERKLMAVLLPEMHGNRDNGVLLPLLRSRVAPVSPGESGVAVRVDARDFKLDIQVEGGALVLRLDKARATTAAAETVLDFHLMREAMAREGGNGFTGSMRAVEPRLERLRASIVAMELAGSSQGREAETVFVSGGRSVKV